MGYSIYIVARSPDLRNRMLDFLNLQIPDVSRLHPVLASSLKNYWVDASVLGYVRKSDKPLALGFEIVVSHEAGTYFMREVLKWAAGKIGKRKQQGKLDNAKSVFHPKALVPYLVYDGQKNETAQPIPDLKEYWIARQHEFTDTRLAAYYSHQISFFHMMSGISFKKLKAITQSTLQLLEEKWNVECRYSQWCAGGSGKQKM